MPTATITSKGQITIPKTVREQLQVDTGDRVLFLVREDGVVELRPETVHVLDLVGILEPKDGRHLSVEQMNAVIERAAAKTERRGGKR